jgi:AraC-like DNA-binding protein
MSSREVFIIFFLRLSFEHELYAPEGDQNKVVLAGKTRSSNDIAESRSFSKPGAFTRASRRWGGITAEQWRAQQAVKAENPR